MCSRSDDPTQYDPPITETQREALAILHMVDDWEARVMRRTANLRALGFSDLEAHRLARVGWHAQRGDHAA